MRRPPGRGEVRRARRRRRPAARARGVRRPRRAAAAAAVLAGGAEGGRRTPRTAAAPRPRSAQSSSVAESRVVRPAGAPGPAASSSGVSDAGGAVHRQPAAEHVVAEGREAAAAPDEQRRSRGVTASSASRTGQRRARRPGRRRSRRGTAHVDRAAYGQRHVPIDPQHPVAERVTTSRRAGAPTVGPASRSPHGHGGGAGAEHADAAGAVDVEVDRRGRRGAGRRRSVGQRRPGAVPEPRRGASRGARPSWWSDASGGDYGLPM